MALGGQELLENPVLYHCSHIRRIRHTSHDTSKRVIDALGSPVPEPRKGEEKPAGIQSCCTRTSVSPENPTPQALLRHTCQVNDETDRGMGGPTLYCYRC